jgi:ribosome-binding protein aMBF1 (putative translation factor)
MKNLFDQLANVDAKGNRPAVAAMRAVLARDIVPDREQLGWSQAELARRAGIRRRRSAGLKPASTRRQ